MKRRNQLLTALLLSVSTSAGIALLNRSIKMSALSKNLLSDSNACCYKWRLGNIHYTKVGTGKPLLLIHDLNHLSSGCEWEALIPLLKDQYTIYTIDLLGCGRSEKPNLTYTNFLYVQLLSDFIKSEIGRRTNVIATGHSASLVTMACSYAPDLFEQLMFINPETFASCSQIPRKHTKLYKFLLDTPILGTLLYHIASSRKTIESAFAEQYFYNPYHVKTQSVDKFYEASHLGSCPQATYSSIHCNYTKCSISRSLEKIDNSIYLIGGEEKSGIQDTLRDYIRCNPAIESSVIPETKHLPHLEKPAEVCAAATMFFA